MVQNSTQIGIYPKNFETEGVFSPDPQPIPGQSSIQYSITPKDEGITLGRMTYGPCHFRWSIARHDQKALDVSATVDEPQICSAQTQPSKDNALAMITFTINP